MKEAQKHIDAFELYFQSIQSGMSVNESILSVQKQCTVSERTVWRWHSAFDWSGRTALRSKEINKKVEQKTNSTIVANKARYLRIYHSLLDDLERRADVTIKNVNDLQMVVKGTLLLQDEPTENIKENVNINAELTPDKRADLSDLCERWDEKTDKSSGSGKGGHES